MKVLFICLGNICRSPMAQAVMEKHLKAYGLAETITCDSAGTARYHIGEQPDDRTLSVLADHGIQFRHTVRQVNMDDAVDFDYILAMDSQNFKDLHRLFPGGTNIKMMRDFDHRRPGADVPDPYYGSIKDFETCYEILDHCTENFIQFLKKQHQL